MAAAEQRDQQLFDDVVLTDDDAAQLTLDVVKTVAQFLDGVQVFLAQVFDGAAVAIGLTSTLPFLPFGSLMPVFSQK